MKQKLVILFIILLLGGITVALWWSQAVKPINLRDQTDKTFVINKGENARKIAERLQNQNLIRSAVAFFLFVRFGGLADNIQAGEFRLTPAMDLKTIAYSLTHGTVDAQITIPEGFRNEEIALRLTQTIGIPESEFINIAREGYMFPDTYRLPKDSTAKMIVNIFLKNFNTKVTPKEIELAKQKNLTLNDLITIASLVEREAKHDADRPLIASVILNRLKIGMKLDIDATVQYALGYQSQEKTWWKKELTTQDLEADSPYNTYKNPGLPQTPISNPGLAAILSVLEAPKTDYLFYIADKSGKTYFAKSSEEHNLNISKYQNK